jgi:uncharacterized delta-60 repeat protein
MRQSIERLEPRRLMDGGELDTSFGAGGFIERTLPGHHLNNPDVDVSRAGDMLISAVALGDSDDPTPESPPVIALWRMHPDGTPLGAWGGGDGLAIIELPADLESSALALARSWFMPDGGVLVQVGRRLWKLRTDGSLDKGFGHNGRANFTDFRADRVQLDVDAQGRIYFASGLLDTYALQVLRLNPDCSLDTTFGGDGIVEPADIPNTLAGHRVRALDNGKVLLNAAISTGVTTHNYVAVRLNPDGSPDPTYGSGGSSVRPFGGGPDDDNIVESVNPLPPTGDGYAPFHFSVYQQESPFQVLSESVGAYNPSGAFIETFVDDPSLTLITRNDALFLSWQSGQIEFLDAGGARLDAPSDAAADAVAIPGESGLLLSAVALAGDGTIVVANNSIGEGTNNLDNVVRLHRLFRDDAPDGQPHAKNLTKPRAASYRFIVQYRDDDGVDLASLGDDDLTVALPGGGRRRARLVRTDVSSSAKVVNATYLVTSPDGVWSAADNGVYTVRLERRSVRDTTGVAAAQRPIGVLHVIIAPSAAPSASPSRSVAGIPPAAARNFDFDARTRRQTDENPVDGVI